MYTTKEHQQSYEMDQQQHQQVSPQVEVPEDAVEATTSNDNGATNNGVRGSLGSLGGPRIAAGDMLYDGHGSLSGKFISYWELLQRM